MTQNHIRILVETVDFASTTLEDLMILALQHSWEVSSFKISNGLQI